MSFDSYRTLGPPHCEYISARAAPLKTPGYVTRLDIFFSLILIIPVTNEAACHRAATSNPFLLYFIFILPSFVHLLSLQANERVAERGGRGCHDHVIEIYHTGLWINPNKEILQIHTLNIKVSNRTVNRVLFEIKLSLVKGFVKS